MRLAHQRGGQAPTELTWTGQGTHRSSAGSQVSDGKHSTTFPAPPGTAKLGEASEALKKDEGRRPSAGIEIVVRPRLGTASCVALVCSSTNRREAQRLGDSAVESLRIKPGFRGPRVQLLGTIATHPTPRVDAKAAKVNPLPPGAGD